MSRWNTGRPSASRTASATAAITGASTTSSAAATTRSQPRFTTTGYHPRGSGGEASLARDVAAMIESPCTLR